MGTLYKYPKAAMKVINVVTFRSILQIICIVFFLLFKSKNEVPNKTKQKALVWDILPGTRFFGNRGSKSLIINSSIPRLIWKIPSMSVKVPMSNTKAASILDIYWLWILIPELIK